jgi:hypothetical protein
MKCSFASTSQANEYPCYRLETGHKAPPYLFTIVKSSDLCISLSNKSPFEINSSISCSSEFKDAIANNSSSS